MPRRWQRTCKQSFEHVKHGRCRMERADPPHVPSWWDAILPVSRNNIISLRLFYCERANNHAYRSRHTGICIKGRNMWGWVGTSRQRYRIREALLPTYYTYFQKDLIYEKNTKNYNHKSCSRNTLNIFIY